MNKEEFVNKLIIAVRDSGIEGLIKLLIKPPGRSPSKSLIEMSTWYNNLTSSDQEMLKKVIIEAIDGSIFGFLCVLDGVRAVKDRSGEDHFDLTYTLDGETSHLTNEQEEYLHDIYHSAVMNP
ncbi:MAG: hypothetical protein ACRYGR_04240 [Janthinobacterium lividum]